MKLPSNYPPKYNYPKYWSKFQIGDLVQTKKQFANKDLDYREHDLEEYGVIVNIKDRQPSHSLGPPLWYYKIIFPDSFSIWDDGDNLKLIVGIGCES